MTKKQRNRAYKKALVILEENFNYGLRLCSALDDVGFGDSYTIMDSCPEAQLFKPTLKNGWYWFNYDDLQRRQIILDFCIEMTS